MFTAKSPFSLPSEYETGFTESESGFDNRIARECLLNILVLDVLLTEY